MIMFNDSYKICLDFHETFTNFSFDTQALRYIYFYSSMITYAIFYLRWNG